MTDAMKTYFSDLDISDHFKHLGAANQLNLFVVSLGMMEQK